MTDILHVYSGIKTKWKKKKKITLLAEEMTHTPLSPTLGFPNMHSAAP